MEIFEHSTGENVQVYKETILAHAQKARFDHDLRILLKYQTWYLSSYVISSEQIELRLGAPASGLQPCGCSDISTDSSFPIKPNSSQVSKFKRQLTNWVNASGSANVYIHISLYHKTQVIHRHSLKFVNNAQPTVKM